MERIAVSEQWRKEALRLAIRALVNEKTPGGFVNQVSVGDKTYQFLAVELGEGFWLVKGQ